LLVATIDMSINNNNNISNNKQYCILFYKYHPLTDDKEVLETYRHATEVLCTSLNLTGRILIGLSNNGEGINGTLAGSRDDLNAYVNCMLNSDVDIMQTNTTNDVDCKRRKDAVTSFHNASKEFFAKLNKPQLFLESPNDFKWSSWSGQGEGDELLGVCPGGKRGDNNSCNSTASSSTKNNESWFPDLHIKIVKEIISSGGAFKDISTQDTSVGYLTPKEWHMEMKSLIEKNTKKEDSAGGDANGDEEVETVLIDVRNHKECQIGSFAPGLSIDPQTKTFSQFPKWVKENSVAGESATPNPSLLTNKRILMYCTGGIRCEKASAYIRQTVPNNKGIYHLKGGIHKYLEEFGNCNTSAANTDDTKKASNTGDCLFVGKNFVFDRRGALDAKGHGINNNRKFSDSSNQVDGVVGKCKYCTDPYDVFHPDIVCCVCREPILACSKCQRELSEKQRQLRGLAPLRDGDNTNDISCRTEYHCEVHFHLKSCYFTSLIGLSKSELEQQLQQLQSHHKELEGTGKKGKQKRRTLRKQIEKIQTYMKQPSSSNELVSTEKFMKCRHCGTLECNSDCWGFHGGNKRMENNNQDKDAEDTTKSHYYKVELKTQKRRKDRLPSNQRPAKLAKRENDLSEIKLLQLSNSPSHNRKESTGMRVPPPVVRVLQSGVKGKWVGKTVKWLFNNEFGEKMHGLTQRDRDERLEQLIRKGLIRINGVAVESSNVLLRNMDTIEHIVHWHEPPVLVPSKIEVLKHALSESILPTNNNTTTPLVYSINKPSSVPIYPSGPYYANSLLLMVEAQEALTPKTLIPLHRIDRATSGVLLCANMSSVAKVIQARMSSNSKGDDDGYSPVRKLYIARVKGKFPVSSSEGLVTIRQDCASFATVCWHGDILEVDAPIAVDLGPSIKERESSSTNAMMHRSIRSDGKQSVSRFKLIAYDEATDQSLVSCAPISGRGHQLRVHLELIGHPIHNDVEYGGSVDSDSMQKRTNLSAQSMLDTSATAECRHVETVSDKEVKAAIKMCKCCDGLDGIKDSFNSAQLLGGGHAIDLHAYKYCISFENKEKIEFSTNLPTWASNVLDAKSCSLEWLK